MTELKLQSVYSISCHAWNANKTKLALCPNNNEIHIYTKKGNDWEREFVLSDHDAVVTGLDWAPNTNRIVSSSQDRNAYVWTFNDNVWKPVLVILRLSHAATVVRWSPKENKFAVGSSAKSVAVCYFDQDNNWWVSKIIKKHKSTVLSLAWHPNNVHLLTGSSDFKARVFSAFLKELQEVNPTDAALPAKNFGEILAEYVSAGWVHSVAWSPNGSQVAFVAHDSSITFIDVASGSPQTLRLNFLPLVDVVFINENSAIAAGHDCSPLYFTSSGGNWSFSSVISEAKKAEAPKAAGAKAAMQKFQNLDSTGQAKVSQTLNTLHQNCITWIRPAEEKNNQVTQFSTSGLDGKVILWNVPA